jgi:hypothetical protein
MAVSPRHVKITSPCQADLDPDRGQDGAKSWYCGHCDKNVHVLSNMTETDARALLAEKVGQDLCVSYAVRADGTIRFKAPEPKIVPLSSVRRRSAAAAAAVGLSAALAACAPHEPPFIPARAKVIAQDAPPVVVRNQPTIPEAGTHVIVQQPPEVEPDVFQPQEFEPEIDERRVDGGIKAIPIEEPERPPVPGGLMVEPLPPPEPIATPVAEEEPCDGTEKPATPEAAPPPMVKGGLRAAHVPGA